MVVRGPRSVDRWAAGTAGVLAVALTIYAVMPSTARTLRPAAASHPPSRGFGAVDHRVSVCRDSARTGAKRRVVGCCWRLRPVCSLRAFGSTFKQANSSQWLCSERPRPARCRTSWDTETAAATALLWSSAGAMLHMMLPLWFRRPLTLVAERAAWPERHQRDAGLPWIWFGTATTAALLPPIGFLVGLALTSAGRCLDISDDLQRSLRLTSPEELLAALFACAVIAAVGMAAGAGLMHGRKFEAGRNGLDRAIGSTVVAVFGGRTAGRYEHLLRRLGTRSFPILGPRPQLVLCAPADWP